MLTHLVLVTFTDTILGMHVDLAESTAFPRRLSPAWPASPTRGQLPSVSRVSARRLRATSTAARGGGGARARGRRALTTAGRGRFAYDSYRRLLDMFGDVVMGVHHKCATPAARPA